MLLQLSLVLPGTMCSKSCKTRLLSQMFQSNWIPHTNGDDAVNDEGIHMKRGPSLVMET